MDGKPAESASRSAAASPFLKWAGGKGRLLRQLEPLLPERFGRYIEPFVGSGALFFRLVAQKRIAGGAVLNDSSPELMNCYRVLQDEASVGELVRLLCGHARRVTEPEYYYRIRALDRAGDFIRRRSPVERAARTIFLNHACYNGLCRLNRSGQFNVPYGKWGRPPRVFDESNLWACHRALQGVELREESFERCLDWAEAGGFVYFDPPYHPLSSTSSFTTYTGAEFREEHQRRLAEVFRALDGRGCLLLLSNSATPLIRQLYEGYRIETVWAARAINSKAGGRGRIEEVVVRNFG